MVQSLPPIGGRLSAFSAEWTKIGASEWVRRTLLEGYSLPFSTLPPLTSPIFLASYQNLEKRRALHIAVKEIEMKGAIEVVRTPSPGFYSRLFLVPKARGAWRPIIDLSALNTHIQCPSFKMETNGSVLKALQKGQWLTILDLKDAYFHILIHPSYRHYLRFCHEGVVWQFRALPFGLNTTPRVFTMVTAPVVAYAHLNGVSLHVYLDDWLLNLMSEESAKQQTQWLLDLCARLGWVINVEKSCLTPSQVATYLGISLDTRVGLAYPSERRIERWLSISEDFLAGQAQPALLWLRLLGHLASLEKLVPYGRLRIRPIQFQLRSGWSQTRDHPRIQVNLDQGTRDSILWWRTHSSLHKGIPLGSPLVEAFLFTDSSAVGWGAHMDERTASGRWSEAMKELHINVLELNAIWLGLQAFEDTLQDSNVAIMCDNVSAIAYLRNQGGTQSQQMCCMAIDTCVWAEERSMTLIPRHLPGHLNVLADHLSRRDQILKTEWSLNPAVARRVFRVWGSPQVDLFALKCNTKLATYMSPIPEPEAWKVDSLVQSWEGLSVRLRVPTNGSDQTDSEQVNLAQSGTDSHSPLLADSGMVSGPPTTVHSFPVGTSTNTKVAEAIILSSLSSEGSDLKPSRVEVICRSNQARGFSEQVSNRIAVPQRKSTLDLYEQKWNTFREWCELNGINPHTPTVPMIADFLLHLFRDKQLATITIKGYRSALSSLMASRGLDISHDPDLNALIRSFSIERPRTVRETPRWDLSLVLRFLMRHPFEPMNVCSLADLTRKTAFLLTLASAKRNSEVWAFSADVVFGHDKQSATLRFLPGFIAKT